MVAHTGHIFTRTSRPGNWQVCSDLCNRGAYARPCAGPTRNGAAASTTFPQIAIGCARLKPHQHARGKAARYTNLNVLARNRQASCWIASRHEYMLHNLHCLCTSMNTYPASRSSARPRHSRCLHRRREIRPPHGLSRCHRRSRAGTVRGHHVKAYRSASRRNRPPRRGAR